MGAGNLEQQESVVSEGSTEGRSRQPGQGTIFVARLSRAAGFLPLTGCALLDADNRNPHG